MPSLPRVQFQERDHFYEKDVRSSPSRCFKPNNHFFGRTPQANSHSTPPIVTNQNPGMAAIPDVPGTIDGAKNPELIPDHVAYSAIFRMLSNRHTKDEIDRVRAYVKQMGLENRTAGSVRQDSAPPTLTLMPFSALPKNSINEFRSSTSKPWRLTIVRRQTPRPR